MTDAKLTEIRESIDATDDQILELFLKRMELCNDVATYKKENNVPVLDKGREREKLASVLEKVPSEMSAYTMALFETLFEVSKSDQSAKNNSESPLVKKIEEVLSRTEDMMPETAFVACQGIEGAFSQLATDKLFKHANISYFPDFRSVFKAVKEGFCNFGVIPLENSSAGTVNEVYDLMSEYDFYIAKTVRIKVNHNLLAKAGTKLADVKTIFSHQQAINQCSRFLSQLDGVEIIPVENTAIAAARIQECGEGCAAIASASAADAYDLSFVEKSIEDNSANYTRFACISKDLKIYPGASRTSLSIVTSNEPGSLYKVISRFNTLEINMVKLESRPIPNRDFDYMFYFDVDCSVYSTEFKRLMSSLDDVCEEFRYLGSYSEII
jgi:chorismate mutase / prephenate dehydratase